MKDLGRFIGTHRIMALSVMAFATVYVAIGCWWSLAPDDKFFIREHYSINLAIAPAVLGWSTFFLKFPPWVFLPVLAVSGGLAGFLTCLLFSLKWPIKVAGITIWVVLVYLNFISGAFLYIFGIMIW